MKLADNKNASWKVAEIVADDFDRMAENTREVLLMKVAENIHGYGNLNVDTAGSVGYAVALNYDRMAENTREVLLMKVVENYEAVWNLVSYIAMNFDKLAENAEKIFLRLAENKDVAPVGFGGNS